MHGLFLSYVVELFDMAGHLIGNDGGSPGKVAGIDECQLDEHHDRYGQQHAAGTPHPAPEEHGQNHHRRGDAELLAQENGFDTVADGEVNADVTGRDDGCITPATHEQSHDDRRNGCHDGADGGDVVEHESYHTPEESKGNIPGCAGPPCQGAGGGAGNVLDEQVALNAVEKKSPPAFRPRQAR